MKKKLYITIILCIVAVLGIGVGLSFILPFQSSKIARGPLRIRFKADTFSNMGYASAVGDDRIYYISNEDGTTGIYSMEMDGQDIQLEVANPSVSRLQWREGQLYFTGLDRIEDNRSTVPWTDHIYAALFIDDEHAQPTKLPCTKDKYSTNVRGFHIISDKYTAVEYGPQGDYICLYQPYRWNKVLYTTPELEKVGSVVFNALVTEQEPIENNRSPRKEISIYSLGDTYITITLVNEWSDIGDELSAEPQIIDPKTGEVVLSQDIMYKPFKDFQVLYLDDNYLYSFYKDPYFSQTGQMVIVNRENWEVEKMFPLGDIAETHRVSYAMKRDGKIYMLAEQWSSDDAPILPLKNQKLLVMDPETFEWEVVRDMKEGERIVGLDERGIVYLADGGIWKAEWEGEALGGETRLCDAPKDIDKEKYTIDYAGDWMFVYKVYGGFTTGNIDDDPGQQLVYKINLKTGEVVENTVPLDFSQVDPYRRDSKTK